MDRRGFITSIGAIGAIGATAFVARNGMLKDNYKDFTLRLRAPLKPEEGVSGILRAASLAANGHNTQPWEFVIGDKQIQILPNFLFRTPVVDPDDHHLYVSLGCAAQNMAIAGSSNGYGGELSIIENGNISYHYNETKPKYNALSDAITIRQSTRNIYDEKPISAETLNHLELAAKLEGVRLVFVSGNKKNTLRDLIVDGNSIQTDDKAFRKELLFWLRFNSKSAMRHGDGLYGAASGSQNIPDWLGKAIFEKVYTKNGENEKYIKQINSSPMLAVFFSEKEGASHWINVGRALESFLLKATELGLKTAFVNQAVEVANLRPLVSDLLGEKGLRPDVIIRFGYGQYMPYSPRRIL